MFYHRCSPGCCSSWCYHCCCPDEEDRWSPWWSSYRHNRNRPSEGSLPLSLSTSCASKCLGCRQLSDLHHLHRSPDLRQRQQTMGCSQCVRRFEKQRANRSPSSTLRWYHHHVGSLLPCTSSPSCYHWYDRRCRLWLHLHWLSRCLPHLERWSVG